MVAVAEIPLWIAEQSSPYNYRVHDITCSSAGEVCRSLLLFHYCKQVTQSSQCKHSLQQRASEYPTHACWCDFPPRMGWQANSSKLPCFYCSLLQMKIKTCGSEEVSGWVLDKECRMEPWEIPFVSPASLFSLFNSVHSLFCCTHPLSLVSTIKPGDRVYLDGFTYLKCQGWGNRIGGFNFTFMTHKRVKNSTSLTKDGSYLQTLSNLLGRQDEGLHGLSSERWIHLLLSCCWPVRVSRVIYTLDWQAKLRGATAVKELVSREVIKPLLAHNSAPVERLACVFCFHIP